MIEPKFRCWAIQTS